MTGRAIFGDNIIDSTFGENISSSSLVEEKKRSISEASLSKKQSLDPTYMEVTAEDVYDADTLSKSIFGDKAVRLEQGALGTTLDAYETEKSPKYLEGLTPAKRDAYDLRLSNDRDVLAKQTGIPERLITDESVFVKGDQATELLKNAITNAGGAKVTVDGERGYHKRHLRDLLDLEGNSLLTPLNTPENNVDFYAPNNFAARQDYLRQQEAANASSPQGNALSNDEVNTPLGWIENASRTLGNAGLQIAGSLANSALLTAKELRYDHGISDEDLATGELLKAREYYANEKGIQLDLTEDEKELLTKQTKTGLNVYDVISRNSDTNFVIDSQIAQVEATRKLFQDQVNTGNTQEAAKQGKEYWDLAIAPAFNAGTEKLLQGDIVGATVDRVRAIDAFATGIIATTTDHPAGVLEVLIDSLPRAALASKNLAMASFGVFGDKYTEAKKLFKEEHNGRSPSSIEENAKLILATTIASALDLGGDRYIVGSNKGLLKSAGAEFLSESATNVAEQLAGKQDLSKVSFGDAYAEGTLGAGAGGGTTAITNPRSALNHTGRAAGTALTLVSDVIPGALADGVVSTKAIYNKLTELQKGKGDSSFNPDPSEPLLPSYIAYLAKKAPEALGKVAVSTATGIKSGVATLAKGTVDTLGEGTKNTQTEESKQERGSGLSKLKEALIPSKTPKQQVIVEAKESGDVSALLDPTTEEIHDPIAASDIRLDSITEDTSAKEVQEIVEEAKATLDLFTPEIITQLKENTTSPNDKKDLRDFLKSFEGMSDKIAQVEDLHNKDISQSVHDASAAIKARVADAIAAKKKLTDEDIERFGSEAGIRELASMTPEQLEELSKLDAENKLQDIQKRFAHLRQESKGTVDVTNDVMFGSGKKQADGTFFVGGETYLRRIKDAVDKGNIRLKDTSLTKLKRFLSTRKTKLDNLKEAVDILNNNPEGAAERLGELSIQLKGITLETANQVGALVKAVEGDVNYLEETVTQANKVIAEGPSESSSDSLSEQEAPLEAAEEVSSNNPDTVKEEPKKSSTEARRTTTEQSLEEAKEVSSLDPINQPSDDQEGQETSLEEGAEQSTSISNESAEKPKTEVDAQEKPSKKPKDTRKEDDTVAGYNVGNEVMKAEGVGNNSSNILLISENFTPKKKKRGEGLLDTVPDLFNKGSLFQVVKDKLAGGPRENEGDTQTKYEVTFDKLSKYVNQLKDKGHFTPDLGGTKLTNFTAAMLGNRPNNNYNKNNYAVSLYENNTEGKPTLIEPVQDAVAVELFSWVGTRANSLGETDIDSISRATGISSEIISKVKEDLTGLPRASIINELGSAIYNTLNIEYKAGKGSEQEANLIANLGAIAVSILVKTGVVKQIPIKNDAFNDLVLLTLREESRFVPVISEVLSTDPTFMSTVIGSSSSRALPRLTPPKIKLTELTEEELSDTELEVEAVGDTTAEELLDVLRSTDEPSNIAKDNLFKKAVASVVKTVGTITKTKGLQETTEAQRKAKEQMDSNAYIYNNSFIEDMEFLGKDFMLELSGLVSEKGLSAMDNFTKAKNRDITASYNALFDFRSTLKKVTTSFYLNHKFMSTSRYLSSDLISPQGNKLHRVAVVNKEMDTRLVKKEDLVYFKYSALEALGHKVEGLDSESAVNIMFRNEVINNTKLRTLLLRLQTKDTLNEEQSTKLKADYSKYVKETVGHGPEGLAALVALQRYFKANPDLRKKHNPFASGLFNEFDGKTHGPAVFAWMMGDIDLAKKGGIFTDSTKSVASLSKDPTHKDTYQSFGTPWAEALKDFRTSGLDMGRDYLSVMPKKGKNNLPRLSKYLGDLDSTESREMSKERVTQLIYGSQVPSQIKKMTSHLKKGLIQEITRVGAIRGEQGNLDFQELAEDILSLTGRKVLRKELLTFKFSRKNLTTLESSVARVYKDPLQYAVDEVYGNALELANDLIVTSNIIYIGFDAVVTKLYSSFVKKQERTPNDEEYIAILKEAAPYAPSFRHAGSDSNNESTNWIAYKLANKPTYLDNRKSTNENIGTILNSSGESQQSITAHGMALNTESPGVRALSMLTISVDAAIMTALHNRFPGLTNYHDAAGVGNYDARKVSKALNEITAKILKEYSIYESVSDGLASVMQATKDDKLGLGDVFTEATNEALTNIDRATNSLASFNSGKILFTPIREGELESNFSSVDHFARYIAFKAESVHSLLTQNRKQLNVVDNFNSFDSPYSLTPEEADIEISEDNIEASLENAVAEVSSSNTPSGFSEQDILYIQEELEKGNEAEKSNKEVAASLNARYGTEHSYTTYARKVARYKRGAYTFGSNESSIDVDNFTANRADQLVTKDTAYTLFNTLNGVSALGSPLFGNKIDNSSHTLRLGNVVEKLINPVIGKLTLHMNDSSSEGTRGIISGDTDVYIENSLEAPIGALGLSTAEVYVHELVHAVTTTAMKLPTNYMTKRRLERLYRHVQVKISVDMLTPPDSDNATKKQAEAFYDYVFNLNTRSQNYLEEFVAFGKTNENLINALTPLSATSFSDSLDSSRPEGIMKSFTKLFTKLMDNLFNLVNVRPASAKLELDALTTKIAHANLRQSKTVFKKIGLEGVDLQIIDAINQWILAPIFEVASNNVVQDFKNKNIAKVGKIASNASYIASSLLGDESGDVAQGTTNYISEVARRIGVADRGILRSMVQTMLPSSEGVRKFESLLRLTKNIVDQARKDLSSEVHKNLLSHYKEVLTDKENQAIYRVLSKTGYYGLIEHYSMTTMQNMLKDPTARHQEILTLRKQLKSFGKSFGHYDYQSENLAHIMVNGEPKYGGQPMLNSYNIAKLLGTTKKTPDAKIIAKAEEIIYKLSTLRAIDLVNKNDINTVNTIWDVEAKRLDVPQDSSGIIFTIRYSNKVRKDILANELKGDKHREQQGYTAEITNNKIHTKVDTKANETFLNRQGYFIQKEVRSERNTGTKQYLYVNNNAGLATYNTGIYNTSHKQSVGLATNLEFGSEEMLRATRDKIAIADHAYDKGTPPVITNTGSLIAQIGSDGFIYGYSHLVSEQNKRDALQLKESFSRSVGIMAARAKDPEHIKKQNKELVKLIVKDYSKFGKKHKKDFAEISPNSSDPRLKEIYLKMDKDTKRSLRKAFGSDTFYVRNHVLTTAFGQREFSPSQALASRANKEDIHKTMLDGLATYIVDSFGLNRIAAGENIHKELIVMLKDTIVIKLFETVFNNGVSNSLLLWAKGVPSNKISADTVIGWNAVKDYIKDSKLKASLSIESEIATGNKLKNITNELKVVDRRIKNNPMKELIDQGFMSSIVEDLDPGESDFSFKTKIDTFLEERVKNTPKVLKGAAKLGLLTHDTEAYQALRELTQVSDLVARYVLHEHNKRKGMKVEESYNDISDTFVNYEIQDHQAIEALNKFGFLMFTKYLFRMQRVAVSTMLKSPSRALSMIMLADIADLANPYDSFLGNPINRANLNPFPWVTPLDIAAAHPLSDVLPE